MLLIVENEIKYKIMIIKLQSIIYNRQHNKYAKQNYKVIKLGDTLYNIYI